MKAMIFSDLITSKNSCMQLLGITLFVAVFIAISTSTLVTPVACIAAMIPFMYLFSISAYDEQNGWERFRLTFPINRRQVAYGRYASFAIVMVCSMIIAILIGLVLGAIADMVPIDSVPQGLKLSDWGVIPLVAASVIVQLVILLAGTVSLPLILRFGMTKGARLAPVIILLALSAAAAFFGASADTISVTLTAIFGNARDGLTMIVAVIAVVSIVLYCASAVLSARLYEHREL